MSFLQEKNRRRCKRQRDRGVKGKKEDNGRKNISSIKVNLRCASLPEGSRYILWKQAQVTRHF